MNFLLNVASSLLNIFVKNNTKKQPVEAPKRPPIPPKLRESVWVKYHGNKQTGVCYACGTKINKFGVKNKNGRNTGGWHCSHVIAWDKGGPNELNNLRCCCQHCNLSMGNCNIYAYIKNKNLNGPGKNNMSRYFKQNPSQINDVRTNNWGK